MGGRSARRKGHDWERALARRFRFAFPAAGRSVQSSGARGCDVEGLPWWTEAKADERVSLWAALAQAERDRDAARDQREAIVIAKRNRTRPVVVLSLDAFERLMGVQHGSEEEADASTRDDAARESATGGPQPEGS